MLAAGGTGGHLFPAFALAQELARRGIPVDLVTDMRGDRYGADFPARAVYRVPRPRWPASPLAAAAHRLDADARHRRRLQAAGRGASPAAVVGFGGYPAFPPLVAARLRRIPTALHEQNAVLGRANRMLAKRVDRHRHLVRAHQVSERPRARQRARHRQPGARPGDRLGRRKATTRRSARRPVLAPGVRRQPGRALLLRYACRRRWRCCRPRCAPACSWCSNAARRTWSGSSRPIAAAGISRHLAAFFPNLPEEMAKAHLVIGRAGASTVAELTVMGRPSILVPLPHALDNDQLQNALRLAEAGGGLVHGAEGLTPERLANALGRLLSARRHPGRGRRRRQSAGPPRRRNPARGSGRGADRRAGEKRVTIGDVREPRRVDKRGKYRPYANARAIWAPCTSSASAASA